MTERFTPGEEQGLARLNESRERKRGEIFAKIAELLGFGDVGGLSPAQHKEVEAETDTSIETWSYADVFTMRNLSTNRELQQLLSHYHELGEQILDIEGEEMSRTLSCSDDKGED